MSRAYQIAIICVILIVAGFFRFSQLETIPPGLYPDEAMNGNNALQAIATQDYKVFYPENNGREGLFINLQPLSVSWFGNTPWALRVVSALIGVLTVWGLFFLTRALLNWQIAAFSSFFMAISFWHVNFSRIGFRAIMAPMILVWGFYFLWQGLHNSRWGYFFVSGIIWGLGFYTYIAYRIMPVVLAITLVGYFWAVRNQFSHHRYTFTRRRLIIGLTLFAVTATLVALPLVLYFQAHPDDFVGRVNATSVFSAPNPAKQILINGLQTLGMFNFHGDGNWRHNISNEPILFWPIGVLFLAGFLRSILRIIKIYRTHQHPAPVQLLLLSWFFVGLAPTVLSNEGLPHALRALIVSPVVFIFAGKGLWWLLETSEKWYQSQHPHPLDINLPHHRHFYLRESVAISAATVIIFFIALGAAEYHRYFLVWAQNSEVAGAFSQRYLNLANQINALPQRAPKYVIVNEYGTIVNGQPMPTQTIMYLTDTYTLRNQLLKNIHYLSEEDYKAGKYPSNAFLFPLRDIN